MLAHSHLARKGRFTCHVICRPNLDIFSPIAVDMMEDKAAPLPAYLRWLWKIQSSLGRDAGNGVAGVVPDRVQRLVAPVAMWHRLLQAGRS